MKISTSERFWRHVNKTETCWLWTGARSLVKSNKCGAGQFQIGTFAHDHKVLSHRWAWEEVNGQIPEGIEIDHLCGQPLCVRPSHLGLATHRENSQRGNRPGRLRSNNTSGFRGVTFYNGKWIAQLQHLEKSHYLGTFSYPEAAAVAYNVAASKIWGPSFRNLNIVEMG